MSSRQISLADFVSALPSIASPEKLWAFTTDALTQRGVKRISYHLYGGVGAINEVAVRAEGFPEDWVCEYIEQRLHRVDPIPKLARSLPKPFLWSEAHALFTPSRDEAAFLERLSETGIGEGLAMHVRGPAFKDAYVGLGFGPTNGPPGAEGITELQVIAQAAHQRYCELTADHELPRRDLSPKEREVLGWIARGKSNAVIADILGLSRHTIDTLVRRIFDKLGVHDRTMAALVGMGAGMIHRGDIG